MPPEHSDWSPPFFISHDRVACTGAFRIPDVVINVLLLASCVAFNAPPAPDARPQTRAPSAALTTGKPLVSFPFGARK